MNAKPLVLVADDPDIPDLGGLRLERSGYAVVSASDGAEALALAADCNPHIAILDVAMPGLSGLEVTRILRERGDAVSVILLTASARESDVSEGAEAGADAYMTKPFSPQQLELCVRELAVARV
jgi:DNA-binding response OmpR family regulator